ncbi:hypothetical protein ACU4GD_44985 [Cupriavidus basilensis]
MYRAGNNAGTTPARTLASGRHHWEYRRARLATPLVLENVVNIHARRSSHAGRPPRARRHSCFAAAPGLASAADMERFSPLTSDALG